MRRSKKRGLTQVQAGVVLLLGVLVISYLGFTKSIPFQHHFAIKADVKSSSTLRKGALVRIAGVNVGEVTAVEPIRQGAPGARITMRIDPAGRPIHKDATLALRERIFLEGNEFVDLHPGTPTAPILGDGEVIPATSTAHIPVQLDQVLTALQADTRADLVRLLAELSTGLSGKGGIGYNRSVQYWRPAFEGSAIVNDATLGTAPHDLSRYLRGQGTTAAALDRNPPALKSLITNFNTTAAAFAREHVALEQTISDLPRTLRIARPALHALNSSFPPLRRLTADLRPAVRSTGPMIDASLPFFTQARLLVGHDELQGLISDLHEAVPYLAKLNARTPALLRQVRRASSCQNEVILPWSRDKIQDKMFPATGRVYQESVKSLPGLAGESRSGDANGQWARTLAGNGVYTYAEGAISKVPKSLGGGQAFGLTNFPLLGVNPPKASLPPIRYDVPCETQQPPDLRTKPQKPPDQLQDPKFIPPILPLRLSEARALEGMAVLAQLDGQSGWAKGMKARAQAIRKRWNLGGAFFKRAGGTLRVAGVKSNKDANGKSAKGKNAAGKNANGKNAKGNDVNGQASNPTAQDEKAAKKVQPEIVQWFDALTRKSDSSRGNGP